MARVAKGAPVPMLCRYRVKKGMGAEFVKVLKKHWPTLHKAGLTTGARARVLRCEDKAGNLAFVEVFAWKTAESARAAHQSAEVMALWEPMGAMCEDMEFWQTSPEAMPFATKKA
jgi:hypothetical protein